MEQKRKHDRGVCSQDNLWRLINATNDILLLIDTAGTVLAANESAARLYETPLKKILGGNIFTIVPKKLLQASRDAVSTVFAAGQPESVEMEVRGRYFENYIYPVFGKKREVADIAIFIRDITRRKEVEKALQQTEEKYRNIYENATEGIFQVSAEGRFLSANPSLARIHGYGSPDELLAEVTDIARQLYVNPSDRLRLVNGLLEHGSVQNLEVPMYRKDGSLHWISINARAVYDSKGKILYHEGTMQDITERKLTEQELAESEERYRVAIENSNDAVAIIQGDRNLYVNRRFVEIFGYTSSDEVIGQPTTMVVHPDDRDAVLNINITRQRGEDVPSRYEFKGITKSGEIIYIEVSATDITYGGQLFYLVYLRDVTARKKAEEELLLERDRFQTLSENAPFGIAMIDKEGVFTYVNPKFRELFGYTLADVPDGKSWFRQVYPDKAYRKKVLLTWIDDVKNTKPGEKVPRTFTVFTKMGTEKVINFIPVRLTSGEYIISVEDISERMKAQEALIRSHKELERLNSAKTKAVHHISHELKTPLAVIQGNVRLLRNKVKGQATDQAIDPILDTIDRNLKRLFSLSRETDEIFKVTTDLEAGMVLDDLDRLAGRMDNFSTMPPEITVHWEALRGWMNQHLSGSTRAFQAIDLFPSVRQIVDKIRRKAAGRRVTIRVEGENDLFIFMDPAILREVTESLVKNAIENTPDGGTIRVAVEQRESDILLKVTDFGIGIIDENIPYIFDGLYHTRETDLYASKQPYEFGAGGKGLELMLLNAYAKRFGFQLTCESKRCRHIPHDKDLCPGNTDECLFCSDPKDCLSSGGTTFTVTFPVGGINAPE